MTPDRRDSKSSSCATETDDYIYRGFQEHAAPGKEAKPMSLPDSAMQRTEPIVLGPGEGRSVEIGSGSVCTFKVTGKSTHGHFGLFEYAMKPHTAGPRPHIHKNMEEIFYVADGEVELLLDDQRVTAGRGTIAVVPRGTAHAFSNPGVDFHIILSCFS